MFDAWVVWALIGGIILLVGTLYVVTAPRGRRVLEERALRSALSTKVRDVMSHPVLVAHQGMTVEEASRMMLDREVGCLPVVGEEGTLVGIVTETDLTGVRLRTGLSAVGRSLEDEGTAEPYAAARSIRIGEVMRRRVITATEDESISDAAIKMMDRNVHHLPVVKEDIPVGVVARRDLLALLAPSPR